MTASADTDLQHVSVANLTAGRVDPVRFVEAAAAAGFGAVGLLLNSATAQPLEHGIVGRPEVVRDIRAALRATGTRVFDVEAFILSPDTDLDASRRAMETGAELGASHISVIGTELRDGAALLDAGRRAELFARICDEAAGFGLHAGIEFMLYRDIRTYDEALALIGEAGRPNAGLIVDMLHFQRAGSTPAELAAVPAERVAYVQICDAAPHAPPLDGLAVEARTDRRYPGDGVIPVGAILDAVPDGVQLVIETPVRADAGLPLPERLARAADRARGFFSARRASPTGAT